MIPFPFIPILSFAAVGGAGEGQGSFALLFLFLAIALGISFLCSILEAVLLSSSLSAIEILKDEGSRAGAIMHEYKQDVERPISAILTLNTIAHTVGAAGVGAEATAIFGEAWFGVISAVLTFLILVFSEIIPKTLGATYWKQLLVPTGYILRWLVRLLLPAVWIFEKMAQILSPKEGEPVVTRAELEVMARIGGEEGEIEARENLILSNLLELREVAVEKVMTPRTVVMALQKEMTIGEVVEEYKSLPYSRVPIYTETLDDVEAYVLRHDIYKLAAADEDNVKLKDISRRIHAIHETVSVADVLGQFLERKKQDHMFLVLDEYGGMAGVITLEDTMEELLGGEITDESDVHEDMREFAEEQSKAKRTSYEPTTDEAETPDEEPVDETPDNE